MNNTKNKLMLAVLAVLTVISITGVAAWQNYQARNAQQKQRQQLAADLDRLFSTYKTGELDAVELSTITPFAWEKFYVFGPYSTNDQITEITGINADTIKTDIAYNDGIVLFVFVEGNEIIHYLEYPRNQDFAFLGNKAGYSPAEAVFVLNEKGSVVLKAP